MEPVNYGLIFSYGIQMTIVFVIGLGLYTIKVLSSRTATIVWYQENGMRIAIALGLFWVISAGLVIVPNFAAILGSWGFNADQSSAGIAVVIVAVLIKTTATETPAVKPSGL